MIVSLFSFTIDEKSPQPDFNNTMTDDRPIWWKGHLKSNEALGLNENMMALY